MDAVRKAHALIEALPYIRSFQGKIVVIKLGGAAMDDMAELDGLLVDVAFMATVGMRPVIVHGGGPAISREMAAQGLEARFVRGHRVTDEATLSIVVDVLANRINADIAARLDKAGGRPARACDGRAGHLRARRKVIEETGADGAATRVDLGLVGIPDSIDREHFLGLCASGQVPVVAPLARGPEGEVLNVNADLVASFLATALEAEKIVFLSDTHGILTDPGKEDSFAPTLTEEDLNALVRDGVIAGGMLPKVEACVRALDGGVRKAHIIDGRMPHSLLLEIFTDQGVGTQIVK